MDINFIKQTAKSLLNEADVAIDGKRPWDIKVNDDKFYRAVLAGNTLALGESYMRGDWDCQQIDELIYRLLTANISSKVKSNFKLTAKVLAAKVVNEGRKTKAFEIAEKHYNLGNDLFEAMLDKRMVYTCGYWRYSNTLDEAQEDKLDLICKKIGLKKGMTVLDIGGGWGSFVKFAAKHYGVKAINITVSKEQIAMADEKCKGLKVENRLIDYRDATPEKLLGHKEPFDRIVSIGMFEHVGPKNYHTYMEVAKKNLKDDGLFLLHTIGANITPKAPDPWIHKYIFPNSVLPSSAQIAQSIENKFVMEDWHNFGPDYDKTLMAWHKNFEKSWDKLKKNYSNEFYRMWRLYLLSCAGSFRARNIQLWQVVLSPKGVPGGYRSVR